MVRKYIYIFKSLYLHRLLHSLCKSGCATYVADQQGLTFPIALWHVLEERTALFQYCWWKGKCPPSVSTSFARQSRPCTATMTPCVTICAPALFSVVISCHSVTGEELWDSSNLSIFWKAVGEIIKSHFVCVCARAHAYPEIKSSFLVYFK